MFKNKNSRLWFAIAIVLTIAISVSVVTFAAIKTNDNPVNLLVTNATEDCKTSVNVSWHAPVAKSTIKYTTADDTEFANAKTVEVDGTLGTLDYYDMKAGKYYTYEYTITGLTEDTKYIYKVSNEKGESDVYTFVTAGTSAFRFISLGDIHSDKDSRYTFVTQAEKMLKNIQKKIGDWDLTIFTGDITQTGATYSDWVQYNNTMITSSGILAVTIGNHDTDNRAIGVKKISNKWFVESLGNPVNGPEGLESVYWFNYNGVLFLCIDTLAMEMSEFTAQQKNLSVQLQWMKDVAKAQEGKYQYIVVYQHNPMGNGSADGFCDWSYYSQLYKTCDEIGADFCLGGDSHEYARSKRLYNNQVVDTEGDKGTIYITNPMVTSSSMGKVVQGAEDSTTATRFSGAGTGATVYTVTETHITFQLVNNTGKVIDEVTIPSRRTAIVTGTTVAGPAEVEATATPAPTEAPTQAPADEPTTEPTEKPVDDGADDKNSLVVPVVVAAVVVVAAAVVIVVVLKKKK